MKLIRFAVAAVAVSLGMSAFADETPDWDYRIRYVTIPSGCYFDTGYAPQNNPKVTMRYRLSGTGRVVVDIFGTATRQEGCFILNSDNESCYYRYGRAVHDGGTYGWSMAGNVYDIVADSTGLTANGKPIFTLKSVGPMNGNTENVTIPGVEYPGKHSEQADNTLSLYSFKMEDGGRVVCEFIP